MTAARMSRIWGTILLTITIFLVSISAQAQTSRYVFLPDQSTLVQKGGIAGIHWAYMVEGQFLLTVDSEAGTASFTQVDANAVDDSPSQSTLDPNEVFNMAALAGTIIDGGMSIRFEGNTDDGSGVLITLTFTDDTITLKGETTPPPNSADFFIFTLDAVSKCRYSGGTGEPNDPYQIATAEDLMLLGESPGDYYKHFILTADIDLDPNLPGRKIFDKAVIALNTNDVDNSYQGTAFTGVFDGNGHAISHLTIRGASYLGLFGQLYSGAMVSDLGLEAVDVNGTGSYTGGLVGYNVGDITNCYCAGTINGEYDVGGLVGRNRGGLMGRNRGSLDACYSAAMVTASRSVGGLVGSNYGGNVTSSYSTGTVSGSGSIGGLVGYNGEGTVTSSYSTGMVSGYAGVGGLVGDNEEGTVTSSYCTGTINGAHGVGGLVGDNEEGTVTSSYSTGMISGNYDVGGLVGDNQYGGSVISSFWDTQTSGQAESDGGIGLTTAQMQDSNSYLLGGWDFVGEVGNGLNETWQMPTEGGYPVLSVFAAYQPPALQGDGTAASPYLIGTAQELGAIVYYAPNAEYRLSSDLDLSGVQWLVAVIPVFEGHFDGGGHVIRGLTIGGGNDVGLFGSLGSDAVVENLGVVDANVVGTGNRIGILTGSNFGHVTSSYSTGIISGNEDVGGLVGSNDGRVASSYSTGTVGGNWYVGGLVGSNVGSVTNSYSTGMVSGFIYVGGLVGLNSRSIDACYSAAMVNGDKDVGGLVGDGYWRVTRSIWDIETSAQTLSDGGVGLTTAEMQTAGTFLDAGWDFIGETDNGTEDIWWILEGQDYPRLWWELIAEN